MSTPQIDIYPEQRSVVASAARCGWRTRPRRDIDRVALTIWPVDLHTAAACRTSRSSKLALPADRPPLIEDPALGFYLYKLPTPLPPHGRIQLDFALQYDNPGFENSQPNTDIVHNGSFVNDRYLPYIGYAPEIELTDDSTRHSTAWRRCGGCRSSTMWPRASTTASASTPTGSTSTPRSAPAPDQIAIAPGYLQKEWVENGRRYFHYKMDAPILDIYSIQSARYAVRRDRWHERESGDLLPARPRVQPRHA